MKNFRIIGFIVTICTLVMACAKDQRLMYEQDPRVYFYEAQTHRDSIYYSFGTKPAERQKDTIYLILRIMGDAAPVDRTINIIAADSSTGKPGRDYDIGPMIIHANKYQDSIPVYLYKTQEMKDRVFTIYLGIGESPDFKPGYTDPGNSYSRQSRLQYKISVTDQLSQPSRWLSYVNWFGAYSKIKFQFMIVSTGKQDWEVTIFPAELNFLAQQAKAALVQYEETNGPLIDEFGNKVVFP